MLTFNIGSKGPQLLITCSCGASAGYNGSVLDINGNPCNSHLAGSTRPNSTGSLSSQTSAKARTASLSESQIALAIKSEKQHVQTRNSVGTSTANRTRMEDKCTNSSPIKTRTIHTTTRHIAHMVDKSTLIRTKITNLNLNQLSQSKPSSGGTSGKPAQPKKQRKAKQAAKKTKKVAPDRQQSKSNIA